MSSVLPELITALMWVSTLVCLQVSALRLNTEWSLVLPARLTAGTRSTLIPGSDTRIETFWSLVEYPAFFSQLFKEWYRDERFGVFPERTSFRNEIKRSISADPATAVPFA